MLTTFAVMVCGALAGSKYGKRCGALMGDQDINYAIQLIQDNLIDSKAFVHQFHPELVVITSEQELNEFEPNSLRRIPLLDAFRQVSNNAFYVHAVHNRKAAIMTTPMAHPDLLGHEMGHHRDAISSAMNRFRSVIQQEQSAWNNSPHSGPQTNELQKKAMSAYKKVAIGSLVGIVVGMVIGSAVLRSVTNE